jgi:oligosaccharide reducing-end xylanase
LPAFYELWALWGAEADRSFWGDAARVSRDFFERASHPKTGLSADYANFDGSPKAASWDPNTVQFRFDSWRTIMNWSFDVAWFAKDPRAIARTDRLLEFFAKIGASYPNAYQVDGTPTSQSSSLGLAATNAVGALAATHPRAWHYVDNLYKRAVPTGKWRYYDGMLYMLSMLHVSGNFRIYSPPQP